jgi:hypothetical protein
MELRDADRCGVSLAICGAVNVEMAGGPLIERFDVGAGGRRIHLRGLLDLR